MLIGAQKSYNITRYIQFESVIAGILDVRYVKFCLRALILNINHSPNIVIL